MASLRVGDNVKIMPSRRQHKENERECRSIVKQLVSSIPQEILISTSYKRKEQENGRQKKTVTFEDQDKEGEEVERNLVQDNLSGEMYGDESRRVQEQNPGLESLSGEYDVEENVHDEEQDLEDKISSGEFRWMNRTHKTDPEKERAPSQIFKLMTTRLLYGDESRQVQEQKPGLESLSGEYDVEENVHDEEQDLEDKILSGEFRWMNRTHKTDPEKERAPSQIFRLMTTPGIQQSTPTQTGTRAQDQNCQS